MQMLSDIFQHGRSRRQQPALIEAISDLRVSYSELADSIRGFGVLLDQHGIQAGDRVTIVCQSSFQQCMGVLACLGNGVVANPLNPALPQSLTAEFVNHAMPSLILSDDAAAAAAVLHTSQPISKAPIFTVEEALLLRWAGTQATSRPISSGGVLIYTSGTTGTAKGVLLSYGNIEANVTTAGAAFGYGAGWVSGCVLPLYHTFSLISDVLPILAAGGTVVVLPTFEMTRAKLTVDAFRKYGVNSYSAPPIILETFIALDCLTDTKLKFAVAGAAPLYDSVKADYETRFGHPIIPCYGLSEATCFATISPLRAIRPNSVGKPANIEICVRDEQGRQLASSETGEIALRGESVICGGYYRDGQRYACVFTQDGWFLTGDIGRMDEDGYVYVTGRKKNMVIRGGEKVYLEDLDRTLVQYPGVADSASIVISAKETWDKAVSFVAPRSPALLTREAIAAHVQKNLGSNYVPDEIVFTDKIPRTPTGKPRHVELKSFYQELKLS